jgi:hypothetical protein
MRKIRNINGSGDCKLGGYAGPVEYGGGGSRKSPDSFTGSSPPSATCQSVLSFVTSQKTEIDGGCNNGKTASNKQAAEKKSFLLMTAFIALVCLCLFAASCKDEQNTLPPDTNPPTVAEITINGLNKGEDGKYAISYNAEIKLGGNAAVSGNSYKWTYTTNPQNDIPNINFAPGDTDASPTVNGFVKGVEYTFILTATNQNGSDTKSVTLKVSQNVAPTVEIEMNDEEKEVTLDKDLIVELKGKAEDDDGNISSLSWACLSYDAGDFIVTTSYTPDQVTALIADKNTATGKVALRKAGTYVFQFKAEDNEGAETAKEITVTVNPIPAASKNVEVTFNAFGATPTVIDLTPTYEPDGGWGNFSASDIKFTISDDRGHDFTSLGSIDLIRDKSKYGSQWPWPPPLFTIAFSDNAYNNNKVEFKFFAGDYGGVGYFNRIKEDTNDDGVYQSTIDQTISTIPPITLTLEKAGKTELP